MYISVIIPFYNSADTLGRCLESVAVQSFVNFEVILINDGSTDDSAQICEKYITGDSRFKLQIKSNSGVSDTRNLGISIASADFLTFIDADDYIDIDFLKNLCDNIQDGALVMQGYRRFWATNKPVCVDFGSSIFIRSTFLDLFREINITKHGFIWGKVFDKRIITKHDIKFNSKIRFSEDLFFLLEYLEYASKAIFVAGHGYNYMDTAGSLSKSVGSFDREMFAYLYFNLKIECLAKKLGLETEVLINNSITASTVFIDRTLTSITLEKNWATRLLEVKELLNSNRTNIFQFYRPKNIYRKVLRWMLHYRLCIIATLILSVYSCLKKETKL